MSAPRFTYPRMGTVCSCDETTPELLHTLAYELRYQIKRMRLTREQRVRFNAMAKRAHEPDLDETAGSVRVSELVECLDEISAPYAQFCENWEEYGWRPAIDLHGDCELPKFRDYIPPDAWGQDVLLVNDHGNVECGYVDRKGKFHEYWSCV